MVVDKYAGRCLDVGSTPTGSIFLFMEDYSRGLRGRVGNAVGVKKRAWVRIPCLPLLRHHCVAVVFFCTIKSPKNRQVREEKK